MNELHKYEVIKEFVDHGGNKHRLCTKLDLSLRQVNRLIKIYKEKGKAGFIHQNRNRRPANSLSKELVNKIITLYKEKYQYFNFSHFKEMLSKNEDINVSYKTIYTILTNVGIYSKSEHKKTIRKRALAKIKESKKIIDEKDIEAAIDHEVVIELSHPRKARAKYFGELIQMDGSKHLWFGESKSTLHLAIDNATGIIVGGYFDKEETLKGYYEVFHQILTDYGIPYKFLTDNRTVFTYKCAKVKSEEKDVLTQFGYACKNLGVIIETSSVSEYKGQIERANRTFQDRLISELRYANIIDMDIANEYLKKVFIPDFNKRFGLDINKFESVMSNDIDEYKINLTLAICAIRKFDIGSAISYKNKLYQAYDRNGNLVCFKKGTECLVIVALDSSMYATVDDKVYELREFIRHKKISKEFDTDKVVETKKPKKHIPPMTHPWRKSNFINQINNAHRYGIYT